MVTVEDLSKATVATIVIETAREAVVRHDVSQVVVGQSFDEADAVTGFTPKFFRAVVAVLDEESSAVDGFVHAVACRAPIGEVRHGLRNVATT